MKTIEFINKMKELGLYIGTDLINSSFTVGYEGFRVAKIYKVYRFCLVIDFIGFKQIPIEIQEDVYKALTLYAQTPISER